jgi:hypothetical protein
MWSRILNRARKESRAETRTLTFDPLPDRERGRKRTGVSSAWADGLLSWPIAAAIKIELGATLYDFS